MISQTHSLFYCFVKAIIQSHNLRAIAHLIAKQHMTIVQFHLDRTHKCTEDKLNNRSPPWTVIFQLTPVKR